MTRPVEKVEPPLASASVQMLCGSLVAAVLVASLVAGWKPFSSTRARESATIAIEVDVNRADALELSLLPGVGPVLANRIAENRERLGPFRSVAELGRVHGFGDKTLAEVEEFVIISHENDPSFQTRPKQATIKSR